MIRDVTIEEYDLIKGIVGKEPLKNIYLFIDIENCGFIGDNYNTLICEENKDIKTIIYVYYNSVQLYSVSMPSANGIKEIASLIVNNGFSMVTGNSELVHSIFEHIKGYEIFDGSLYKAPQVIESKERITALSTPDDCKAIAELICKTESISRHYEKELLATQLEHRMKYEHCRNVTIKRDDSIIGHFGTYAESNRYAVMGGLVVLENYRKQGFGEALVKELSSDILSDKKCPLLFCFSERTSQWYERLGFEKAATCSKLEKIK